MDVWRPQNGGNDSHSKNRPPKWKNAPDRHFFFLQFFSLSNNPSLLFSTRFPLIPCQESGIALRLQPFPAISVSRNYASCNYKENTFRAQWMRRAAFPSCPSARDRLLSPIISCLPVPSGAALPPSRERRSLGAPQGPGIRGHNVLWRFLCSRHRCQHWTHIISFHLRSNVGLSSPTSTTLGRVLGIHLTDEGQRLTSRALDYLLFFPEKSPAPKH